MGATTRRKAPSRLWGRGAIMQPTPRGSGVWVGEQKDTRARRQAAHIRNTAGQATLLPPERKLRSANTARCIGIRDHDERRKLKAVVSRKRPPEFTVALSRLI